MPQCTYGEDVSKYAFVCINKAVHCNEIIHLHEWVHKSEF